MAKTELPPISEETIEMIEGQVKKGKARKFFLINKGASIKTLVVFKKGPFGPKIMKAKKDGFKGDVAYGVVTGSGQKLFFQLPGNGEVAAAMKVDSWEEKPPTKKAKLREFLMGNGLAFKPSYHIITDVAAVPNPDAETDVPVAPPPPGSEAVDDGEQESEPSHDDEAAQPPPVADDQDLAKKLAVGLKKLKPAMQNAVSAAPDQAADLTATMAQLVGQIKAQQYDSARTGMVEFGKRIQSIVAGAAPANAVPDLGSKLAESLKKLKPVVEKVGASLPDQASELRNRMVEIVNDIKAQQFEIAKTRMAELAGLLKRLSASRADVETAATDVHEPSLGMAESLLMDLLANDGEDFFDSLAMPSQRKLTDEELVEKVRPVDPLRAVAVGGRVIWERAKGEVAEQLVALEKAMHASGNIDLQRVARLCRDEITDNFRLGLRNALTDFDNAAPADQERLRGEALHKITQYQELLSADALVRLCDHNPLGVKVGIKRTLSPALEKLKDALSR
ncbi:hypothetical protein [Aporhodopirellula aestuarii]|uniref:Uncharacterized protein n=1 Tax=Aporhodopirellula aestuarii TaxID=2950107 RepID=A0ABT0TZ65_9BACT|nr:hypothetical protein [Aporhodopirellula aestuarii]MCM2369902.1 hypothetical protein [Aporhodopirellula aestuarii]